MQSHNKYKGIDTYALACVRHNARTLVTQHPCFTVDDYEDIEQELVLYFITESPKFDPNKSSWRLHIGMILKKRAIWLGIQAEAQKRGGRYRPLSLFGDVSSDGDGEIELLDTLSSENGLWGDPFIRWNAMNTDLRSDLQRVIAGLPPKLQQICEWLKEMNPSDIARETGIPRTTISSAVGVLRKHLKTAGLEIYLGGSSHPDDSAKPSPRDPSSKEKRHVS